MTELQDTPKTIDKLKKNQTSIPGLSLNYFFIKIQSEFCLNIMVTNIKIKQCARCWWVTPLPPAMQEDRGPG
jgi:hypothetical protein